MKSMIIGYVVSILMDILREMAADTRTTIDDDLVATINENMNELKELISEKL